MPRRRHIDDILRDWRYEPETINVRETKGKDGRAVLQMRVDLGLLQLEVDGRPDGERPHGMETYYDYLLSEALHHGDTFEMTDEQCTEADREFVQFYHRRVCWLALREFEHAVRDADHTLAMMDFCRKYSPDEQWTVSHEQYRPYVLFHRTQAEALSALDAEENGPEAAIQAITDGLDRIHEFFVGHEAEEHFEEDELVTRLKELRDGLRDHYAVGKTLHERLQDAIAQEEYELAAQLRDELAKRDRKGRN